MAGERLAERSDGRRQHALEGRVVLGEADPAAAGRGRGPDGQPLALGELDGGVPAAGGVDVGAGDEHRAARRAQALGERGDRRSRGLRAPGDGARDLRVRSRAGSSSTAQSSIGIETNAGPGGRQRRVVDRLRERERDVGGARRLVAVLDVWLRHLDRVAVGEAAPAS